VALDVASVREEMKQLGVVPIKADYTRKSPLIDEWLARYQKGGVPMYVVLPADPDKKPWLLPEVLTPGIVIEALRAAKGS
jgi:thiol:disulfide interchange protein DsbD